MELLTVADGEDFLLLVFWRLISISGVAKLNM